MALAGVVVVLFVALGTATQTAARNAAQVAKPGVAPVTKAQRVVLMDAETGGILYQQNAEQLVPPNGMSKLMTLAVVFRELKLGKIKLDAPIRMSVNAWKKGGAPSPWTPMFVRVNTTEPLEVLLQGLVVQSANDASIAIAEAIGGNEPEFARMMTAEARRIGLEKATFSNATGMPQPGQSMTMREVATLARFLMREYPEHYARFAQKELKYGKFRFINDNPLLGTLGVDGIRTGFVKNHGYGLVASGNQGGRRLIMVIAGLDKPADVKAEGQKLLEWGYTAFAEMKLFEAGEIVAQARVWGGDRMWLPLTGAGPISIVLPKNAPNQRLNAVLIYKRPLKGPINKGDKVGLLRVTSANEAVSEVPLYAAESVAAGGLVRRGFDTIVHMALGWLL